jgi:hypothetical protein
VRRVFIKGTPPADWVADAEAVTEQLRAATTDTEREQIIEANEKLWRDDRIRSWLLTQFANKCWYTEAYDSVSAYHVDHYRPKGRVSDLEGNTCDGYWWLAFDWGNYRICGQLINVKKKDIFPLLEGERVTAKSVSLKLEAPLLIDPKTDEARLISYEKDEDGCIAIPSAGINETDEHRALKTIEVLGLNRLTRLNEKRSSFWDKCLMAIADHKSAEGTQALRIVSQAAALRKLREMIVYDAEFSSVSEACIRKNAPSSLIASVFEHIPGV